MTKTKITPAAMVFPTHFTEMNELGKQKMPGKNALMLISSGNSVKKYGTLARVEEQLKQEESCIRSAPTSTRTRQRKW